MDAKIEERILSHADVREGFDVGRDPEHIGEYTKLPGILKTYLSNPRIEDEREPLLIMGYLNRDVCGRMFYFPTKIKIGESVEDSLGASSLLVSENARGYSLGADFMMFPIKNKYKNYLLYAGVSKMAEPLYHKLLKFEWFNIPCYWQPRKSKFLYQRFGLRGLLLNFMTGITNSLMKPAIMISRYFCKKSLKGLEVRVLKDVPDWVENLVIIDKHKYAEYHDKKWFEWVLNNNFFQRESDSQTLYGIYKGSIPVGFILIKERAVSIPKKNVDSVVFGTVIEWGTSDELILSEYDINKIALSLYSDNVDIAQVISTDAFVQDRIKVLGFLRHGDANVAFRDLTKKLDKDYKDIKNWRIRVGYSDVPFY